MVGRKNAGAIVDAVLFIAVIVAFVAVTCGRRHTSDGGVAKKNAQGLQTLESVG